MPWWRTWISGDGIFGGLGLHPLIGRKIDLPPLVAMGDPCALRLRTPAHVLRRALVNALIYRAPAAFLVDEAQQLTMVAGARKFQHQMDYIKRLADATQIPIVLVGNYDLCLLRNQSAQLSRRTIDIHLRRYDVQRPQDAVDFKDMVLSLQCHLPLAEPPDLLGHWDYLYLRSVGCIGLLKKWLLDALDRTLEAGHATLTRADLERTAPSTSKGKRVLEEALDGEMTLAELDPEADVHVAEEELRALLRLPPLAGSPSALPLGAPLPSAGTKRRRRPGERAPVRDAVGPANKTESTG